MPRIDWQSVLLRAAEIVRSYETGVTLRQLYYRLVSEMLIPNKQTMYNTLSARSAEARRDGWFPDLVDRGRTIQRYRTFENPVQARQWLASIYRLDRTLEQEYYVWIGVEKNGLLNLLLDWFGDFGVPVVALGGYGSQTFKDEIREDVESDGRPAILIYAGDFDPSGEDILRDFVRRTDCREEVARIGLNIEQIEEFNLPPLPGKASDSRAKGFVERHGELMQVELDALPPDELQRMYMDKFNEYWNVDTYDAVLVQERRDRRALVAANVTADSEETKRCRVCQEPIIKEDDEWYHEDVVYHDTADHDAEPEDDDD